MPPTDDFATRKLQAQEARQRRAEYWETLKAEASALRLKVAKLRNAHAALGWPPPPARLQIHSMPTISIKKMKWPLGPRLVLPPNPSNAERRKYQSSIAQREFRRRRGQLREQLEEEVVVLRAEVFQLQAQMRRFGGRL
ncbi:hypothetical protein K438DRAFT_1973119 [Mycena galopus ATCC 62051]|nr:hypothetical protein K438DRAFT_1973119 [Mycena galopus ATCC 62051]